MQKKNSILLQYVEDYNVIVSNGMEVFYFYPFSCSVLYFLKKVFRS